MTGVKADTFKKRLEILMQKDGYQQPYKWAKAIGIKGGLFQYYWQKGKVPTVKNLIKIQEHTGCSIDWLLTGRKDLFEQFLSGFDRKQKSCNKSKEAQLCKSLTLLKQIYRNDSSGNKIVTVKNFLASLVGR